MTKRQIIIALSTPLPAIAYGLLAWWTLAADVMRNAPLLASLQAGAGIILSFSLYRALRRELG